MKNKKHHHSRMYLNIRLLRIEYLLCYAFSLIFLMLQLFNLLFYTEETVVIGATLGRAHLPFRLTTLNCVPFLAILVALLAILNAYLQYYFKRNSGYVQEQIKTFDKNPHTSRSKRLCMSFIVVSTVVSVAFGVISYLKHIPANAFGTVMVSIIGFFLYRTGKQLRKCKRRYIHHRKHIAEA